MFALLIILLLLTVAAATAFALNLLFSENKPLKIEGYNESSQLRGLFEPDEAELRAFQKEEEEKLRTGERLSLIQEAETLEASGNLKALSLAYEASDPVFYEEVLSTLFQSTNADMLEKHLAKHSLPANAKIIKFFVNKFEQTASALDLTKALRLAASTNSAETYLQTVEKTVSLWDGHKQKEVSPETLLDIIDTHYWLLANEARISGAGFLLKEKLAGMRREILESNRASAA